MPAKPRRTDVPAAVLGDMDGTLVDSGKVWSAPDFVAGYAEARIDHDA